MSKTPPDAAHRDCKIENIIGFALFTPTSRHNPQGSPLPQRIRDPKSALLQLEPCTDDDKNLRDFPALIDPDGSPWRIGNRYLLSAFRRYPPLKNQTLASKAGDLANFRSWCLDSVVDFRDFSGAKRVRPTYKYMAYLHDQIRATEIQPATAKRRMNSIIHFYRWFESDGFTFEQPPWQEITRSHAYKDARGFQRFTDYVATDLSRSFSTSRQSDEFSGFIDDGGKLRPLTLIEQKALFEALNQISNTEMTLGFLIAMFTGARIQAVFTLRRCHFEQAPAEGRRNVRIKIGYGTLVANKNGKQMVLHLPGPIFERVRIYLNSQRSLARTEKTKHRYTNENLQYAFLTRNGEPYYRHPDDYDLKNLRARQQGNSVRQFIRQQLLPQLRENGHNFSFRFHDLRATFGMNLLHSNSIENALDTDFESHESSTFTTLMFVKTMMGHESLAVTERYLNYDKNNRVALKLQDSFEQYLGTVL